MSALAWAWAAGVMGFCLGVLFEYKATGGVLQDYKEVIDTLHRTIASYEQTTDKYKQVILAQTQEIEARDQIIHLLRNGYTLSEDEVKVTVH